MLTLPLTRPIMVNGEDIPTGTLVKASFNEKSGLTTIIVPAIGRRDFLTAPVRFP